MAQVLGDGVHAQGSQVRGRGGAAVRRHARTRRRSVTYGNNDGYDLTVNHIPGGQSGVVVTRYRIDDSDNLTLVELVVISPLRR